MPSLIKGAPLGIFMCLFLEITLRTSTTLLKREIKLGKRRKVAGVKTTRRSKLGTTWESTLDA
jgi:SNF family Na+-dependent transporter